MIKEQGVPPWLGILVALVSFVGLSWFVFYKLEIANYVYPVLAIYIVSRLSGKNRNIEMKRMSREGEYRKWRLIENVIAMSPFVLYLLYERAWWEGLACAIGGVLLSFFVIRQLVVRTIPSPFKRLPFEGIVGFRKTFFVFIIFYLILIPAIRVGNFNLALVLLAANYLLQLAYYLSPEKEYFVWIFSLTRKQFLWLKWRNAMFVALALSLPFAIILLGFYPEKWMLILGAIVLAHMWISAAVFVKYGVYPKEMNVAHGLLFAVAIIVFPLLFLFIPLYYKQANAKLQLYLR